MRLQPQMTRTLQDTSILLFFGVRIFIERTITIFVGYTYLNFSWPAFLFCEKLSAMISKLFYCFIDEHCICYSSWNTPQHVPSLGFQSLVKT